MSEHDDDPATGESGPAAGARAGPEEPADADQPDHRAAPEEAGPTGSRAPKGSLAAGERDARAYDETYGRGGGDRFQSEDYPRSYALPGSTDWRRALRAYVTGHDRGWEADRKYREAGERGQGEPSPGRAGSAERSAPETAARPHEPATARTEAGTTFGVPIPDRLDFHRSASTWRDRLPFTDRLARHGSRDPRGRGRAPKDRR